LVKRNDIRFWLGLRSVSIPDDLRFLKGKGFLLMCGICGVWNYATNAPVDRTLVQRMCDVMSHRGPDDSGDYFDDGKNAYMCASGDASIYAQKIMQVLEDRDEAIRVGMAGGKLAEENFHYLLHSQRLASFVNSLCR